MRRESGLGMGDSMQGIAGLARPPLPKLVDTIPPFANPQSPIPNPGLA